MTNRASRLALIQELISIGNVSSQSELVSLLAKKGVTVTQATLSRDLEILGAIKISKGQLDCVTRFLMMVQVLRSRAMRPDLEEPCLSLLRE